MGGSSKSGGSSSSYVYYGTIACGVCIGPVDALVSIILNGQEVWPQGTPWTGVGGTSTAGTLYVYDAQTWTCTSTVTNTAANAPGGTDTTPGWTEYTFARASAAYNDFSITTSDGTYYGVLRFYWGTSTQTVDYYLQAANNDGPDTHPNYAGLCYVVLIDFMFGQEVQSAPNIEVVVRKAPTQSVVTGSPASLTNGQANLAAVVCDLLTNSNCIGLDSSLIDATSFQASANYLDTVPGIAASSVLVDSTETLRSVLQKVTDLCDGFVRFNPSTGLIEMGVYQHGATPGTYVTLTEDSLTAAPKLKSTSWQGSYSRATVRYNDRQINYQQTSLHADDARAWTILKSVREMSLDRPYITIGSQALAHGREMLRILGNSQISGELLVRREIGRAIRPGSYVLLDVDIEPNTSTFYQFFRVTKRTIPMTGPIKLEIMADNTLQTVPASATGAPVIPSSQAVPAITQLRILEVPTILSGQRGAVTVLAERPDNIITGCQLYFDTDPAGTFSSLGTFPAFAAFCTVHTAIAATDATITVNAGAQVDLAWLQTSYSANDQANDTLLALAVTLVPSGGDAGEIAESSGYQQMEILSVGTITLVSAGVYTLSVLRGRQNTLPAAFAATHTEVWVIPRALLTYFNSGVFDTIRANRFLSTTPAYAQFRLCPFTFIAQLPLSSASNNQFRFPLKSATLPTLVLTAPATVSSLSYAASNYPFIIPIAGTWSDPDGGLVETIIRLRLSSESADRMVADTTFAPCSSRTIATGIQIEQAGSYMIKLLARDANNLSTEVDIPVTVSGSGKTCALVNAFDSAGVPILDAGGLPITYSATKLARYGSPYVALVGSFVAFGPITLSCSTPGATIHFAFNTVIINGVITGGQVAVPNVYTAGSCQPFNITAKAAAADVGGDTVVDQCVLTVWATASGYAASPYAYYYIKNIF